MSARDRLEYLRGELRAERISYSDLAELQGLAHEIDPGDIELLEAAGVPEHPEDETRRWYVVEGDDHEKRLTEAESVKEALDAVLLDFRDQYGSYRRSLLTVLGDYATEDEALAEHDDAC